MRVLVCGSRGWQDPEPIRQLMEALAKLDEVTLVHGDAKGADRLAACMAPNYGVRVEAHPAAWKRDFKAAGPIRNQEMLDSGVDVVFAFRSAGRSHGTDDMIRRAEQAGVPVNITHA